MIGCQVTVMLTVVGLTRGMIEDSSTRKRSLGADIFLKPEGASVFTMSSGQLNEKFVGLVAEQPHVTLATGMLSLTVVALTAISGVDPKEFAKPNGGIQYLEGGPLQPPDDILPDDY